MVTGAVGVSGGGLCNDAGLLVTVSVNCHGVNWAVIAGDCGRGCSESEGPSLALREGCSESVTRAERSRGAAPRRRGSAAPPLQRPKNPYLASEARLDLPIWPWKAGSPPSKSLNSPVKLQQPTAGLVLPQLLPISSQVLAGAEKGPITHGNNELGRKKRKEEVAEAGPSLS
jgi:hypothetical protein